MIIDRGFVKAGIVKNIPILIYNGFVLVLRNHEEALICRDAQQTKTKENFWLETSGSEAFCSQLMNPAEVS